MSTAKVVSTKSHGLTINLVVKRFECAKPDSRLSFCGRLINVEQTRRLEMLFNKRTQKDVGLSRRRQCSDLVNRHCPD
uniref:Uncharacterized protein n=1 Tax=Panagrellus redivivus TaxID=6233 RepID=A0A7E4W468_PANRE